MISVYVMYYGSSFKILLIEIVSFFSIDIQKIKITILNQKFIFCNINITGTANNKQSFASKFIACSSRSSLSQNTAKMYGHHYPITEGVIYGLWTMTSETSIFRIKPEDGRKQILVEQELVRFFHLHIWLQLYKNADIKMKGKPRARFEPPAHGQLID